jgi:hypothetical protein
LRCEGPSGPPWHTAAVGAFALSRPETVSIGIAPADDAQIELRSISLTRQLEGETPPVVHCDFLDPV